MANVSIKPGAPRRRVSFAGQVVKLETKRFKLRSLRPSDASERYLGWIADDATMNPLNMPGRKLTEKALRAHIAEFDNRARYLIGMFDKETGAHFGIYLMDVMLQHRIARLQYFIGDMAFRGIGALRETMAELISCLFERRGIEKIAAQVALDNAPSIAALKALGFRIEGEMKGEIRAFDDGRRIDQLFFGILHDEWQMPEGFR
jgi:RimJ/RimL family protein N-acetyltransferase